MINIYVKNRHLYLFKIILLTVFLSLTAKAQNGAVGTKNKNPFPVKYTSEIDEKIVLKTLTLAPVYDNLDGVYSQPIQKLLVDLLQSDKSWGYSEFPDLNKKIFIENFDTQANEVLNVLSKSKSQGLLTAFITKGPLGLTAKLKLFTQDQGLILIEESFQDIRTFEISKIREIFVNMYHDIKNKLPYRGYVLSRRGLDITLNLGSMNGIRLGQELSLAQIIKLNRHPKLKIIIGAEKEVIAKIKITQVESYLSFAQIIFEKETGVVAAGAKVLQTDFISYPLPLLNGSGIVTGDQPAEAKVKPIPPVSEVDPELPKIDRSLTDEKANVLDRENSLRVFTAQLAVTQYKESSEFQSGSSASSSNNLAPGLNLGILINLMENIFVDFNTQMNFFSGDNSLAGSTPYHLSYSLSRYTGLIGYDYLLPDEDGIAANAIKLSVGLGFASIKTDVSSTSPTALTSTQTDALDLQFKAAMPLGPDYPLTVGAKLDILLSPQFSESPVNSGNAKPSITSIGLFGFYPVTDKLRVRADINVLNISTLFNGTGTRNTPTRSTALQTLTELIGIEYLF